MNIVLLIIAMTVATYLPRAIPAVLIDRLRLNNKAERFLSFIPYTAMTALVFPGVVTIDSNHIGIGIAGALAAILLGWKRLPIIVVILGSVITVMFAYLIFQL